MGAIQDFAAFIRDPLGKEEARDELQAQQASQTNLRNALAMWGNYMQGLEGMTAPYDDPTIRTLTTQQRDIIGAGAANELEQARRLAGASGLGGGPGGGGLATQERLIREEMARRQAAAAAGVQAQATQANSAWQQQMANLRGQATAGISNILSNSPANLGGFTLGGTQYGTAPPAGVTGPRDTSLSNIKRPQIGFGR